MADQKKITKILYVTMSNLGDAVMGLPAFDFLRRSYPEAHLTVIAAPRTACVFQRHPDVDELIIFYKDALLKQKMKLFRRLQREHFDVVVDLKNSFFGFFLNARHKNPVFIVYPRWVKQWYERHLYAAFVAVKGRIFRREEFEAACRRRRPLFLSDADRSAVGALLRSRGIKDGEPYILLAPGARSDLKKWQPEGFVALIRRARKRYPYRYIIVGEERERELVLKIAQGAGEGTLGLAGETDFGQLCALIDGAVAIIANDSGIIHVASYLDKKIVGIYGPSDERHYGPWSAQGLVVRRHLVCAPCSSAHCSREDRRCVVSVTDRDVFSALEDLLEKRLFAKRGQTRYRRILVSRTDRMGDVLITTPVIKALRQRYPSSFIALMVSGYTKELVEGNPYLDEVIEFNKDGSHKGLRGSLSMAGYLRRLDFDVAIILHPALRVHLISFLAGIPHRLGYDRKGSFFLTQTIPHKKQEGLKHEFEYNFDLLKLVDVTSIEKHLYVPLRQESEDYVQKLLCEEGFGPGDLFVVIHPAASCVSRRWPLEKFVQVMEALGSEFRLKFIVIADLPHRKIAEDLVARTTAQVYDFSGRFSLSQLASLVRRASLMISNDSGPVHLAVAVQTPVIAIFGRNQPGLGPMRWGPLGPMDVAVHKKTECSPCMAHHCQRGFLCLDAIDVDEIVQHAREILKSPFDRPNLFEAGH